MPAPPSPATASARVLLAVPRNQGVEWHLFDPADGSSAPLGTAARDATLLTLDDTTRDFYFAAGGVLWRQNWRTPSAAQRVASLPTAQLQALWIDAGTGALRALEMRAAGAAEARRMKAEPPDARPYWALLWALRDGKWSVIGRRATSWEADGAVGPAVFDDLRRERGRSAWSVAQAADCPRLCDQEAAAPEGVAAGAAEQWRVLPGSDPQVVFGVALGDAWHPVGPVLARTAPAATLRTLQGSAGEALRLQWRSGWLLVSPALEPSAVRVVDPASGASRELGTGATLPAWVD